MEDIKKLIEDARKQLDEDKAKLQAQAEENARLQAELDAINEAPPAAPPVGGSVVGRVLGIINKINETKANGDLKVANKDGTIVDINTMDGSTEDKELITAGRVHAIRDNETRWAKTNLDNVNVGAQQEQMVQAYGLDGAPLLIKKSEISGGGDIPFKDITATYKTRAWTDEDAGKLIRIKFGTSGTQHLVGNLQIISSGDEGTHASIIMAGEQLIGNDIWSTYWWNSLYAIDAIFMIVGAKNGVEASTEFRIRRFEIEEK